MDIEKLKRKRQLNVQEQNVLEKDRIRKEALYWRNQGIPKALLIALQQKNIDVEKSIFLNYEQDFPGVCTDEGMVLTSDGQFYEFEMDLNKDRTELIEFYVWENVSDKIEINEHKRGTGATWGFMALEILAEINQC